MLKQKSKNQDLTSLHQKFELLMRNTEEPFVLIDTNYTIITFNEQFKNQYFKYFGKEFLKGDSILEYAQPHRVDLLKKMYLDVFNGQTFQSEIEIPFPDNSKRTFLNKYKPALNEDGKIMGAFISSSDITGKLIFEGLQKTTEKRFQALIENASEIISLTNKEGNIIYVSPSLSKITGYSFDELIDVKHFVDKMHPDEKKDSKTMLEEVLKNPGVPIYRLNRIIHKNGGIIWMEGTVTNLLHNENVQAIVSNFRNITEKKEAEEKLKESENTLRTIFDNIEEGIILLDEKCIIKAFNSKANENNMIATKDLKIGESLIDYIKPERVDYFKECMNKTLNGESVEYDIDYKQNDGTHKWFHATLKPVKENKTVKGVCIARRDITKRKNSEAELKAGELKYKLLSEELAAANTELEQFAYTASHDLQEPLRMITSFLTQLELKYKDQLDDKAKQYIYFATDGATRLRKIILDLLEYSLAGRKTVEFEQVNIETVLAETIQLSRKTIEEKSAVVEWNNMPVLTANRSSMLQVFQNLIGNALKYQKAGQKPILKINAVETNTHWQFSFSDNGIGIEPQFFEKIFIAFHRLHNRSEYDGTGLGLAICKKIIENHGGRIWLESNPDKGSTFHFTLLK